MTERVGFMATAGLAALNIGPDPGQISAER